MTPAVGVPSEKAVEAAVDTGASDVAVVEKRVDIGASGTEADSWERMTGQKEFEYLFQ